MTPVNVLSFLFMMSFSGGLLQAGPPELVQVKTDKTIQNGDQIAEFSPVSSHHFNLKAPYSLHVRGKKILPQSIGENRIAFSIPKASDGASFIFRAFVCDEAKTFCRRVEVNGPCTSQKR